MTEVSMTAQDTLEADLNADMKTLAETRSRLRERLYKAIPKALRLKETTGTYLLPVPQNYWERAMRQRTIRHAAGNLMDDNVRQTGLPVHDFLRNMLDHFEIDAAEGFRLSHMREDLLDAVCGSRRHGYLLVPEDMWMYGKQYGTIPLLGNMPFTFQHRRHGVAGWFVVVPQVTTHEDKMMAPNRETYHWPFRSDDKAMKRALWVNELVKAHPQGDYKLPNSHSIAYGLDAVDALVPRDFKQL